MSIGKLPSDFATHAGKGRGVIVFHDVAKPRAESQAVYHASHDS